MIINNVQIVKTIGAMYRCTNGGDGDWTDTDEAIQQAALKLWESHTCSDEEAAVMLFQHTPFGFEEIADFLDVDERVVKDAWANFAKVEYERRMQYLNLRAELYQEDVEW